MSSPWGKIMIPESINLQDIISEQLAKDLQTKQGRKHVPANPVNEQFESVQKLLEEQCLLKSEEDVAKALQQQANVLKDFENKLSDFDSDSNEEGLENEDEDIWDKYDTVMSEFDPTPAYTTKNMKSASKMISFRKFPLDFDTGDDSGCSIKISNKLFNNVFSLRLHNRNKRPINWRNYIPPDADTENVIFGINSNTRTILFEMKNKHILEQVDGVVSVGKEAFVFIGKTYLEQHKECIIKVFKSSLSEYRYRDKYMTDISKYTDKSGKLNNTRMIRYWAENEVLKLKILQNVGIPCPQVIALQEHVLILSLIGTKNVPAPMLKCAKLDVAKRKLAYEQVVGYMKTLYTQCNLIHSDLSEYNILWHNNTCYVIDLSQSIEVCHQNAIDLLYRDCRKISKFFSDKRCMPNVATPEDLFMDITGCDYKDKLALVEFQASIKMKKCTLRHKPSASSAISALNSGSDCDKLKCEHLSNMDNSLTTEPSST